MDEEFKCRYEEILNTNWPDASVKKEKMRVSQRAKIFLPFSALTGYEESLAKTLASEQHSMERKPGIEQFFDEEY